MAFSREIPPYLSRYPERSTFTGEEREIPCFRQFTRLYLIIMLDKLNRAKDLYDEATNEKKRQEADKMFADYYDWFTQQQIPIIYDQTIHRWLLAGRHEEATELTHMK